MPVQCQNRRNYSSCNESIGSTGVRRSEQTESKAKTHVLFESNHFDRKKIEDVQTCGNWEFSRLTPTI